jgi:hypothetical protein
VNVFFNLETDDISRNRTLPMADDDRDCVLILTSFGHTLLLECNQSSSS